MWLKLCLLLIYITLLFILSRVLDAISWCELSGTLSRQFLDPMLLSVAKLKALLEQRGVSYEGVLEKSELSSLVEASGQVSAEEAELAQEDRTLSTDTNFTSGSHFIEQVEDAKDSVWLVQIVSHANHHPVISEDRWKTIRLKVSKFGVRTGLLDCSLDQGYCNLKGWHSPFLLLALPSQFEKKANVAMYNYSGSVKESALLGWLRDKLDEKVVQLLHPSMFEGQWKNFSSNTLEPQVRAVLFTRARSAPLFYSALTVKFPGRVKFGIVSLPNDEIHDQWKHALREEKIDKLPAYVIYCAEKAYRYGGEFGEQYSFISMEQFLKFLYPCLNDVFIVSFCVANVMSWFELFVCNCSCCKRFGKLIWCMFKYNIVVIMLWLPLIGLFQMPYLDRVPMVALKLERLFSTSSLGTLLRGDYNFFVSHPHIVYTTFMLYLVVVTILCRKYRAEEEEDDWFNFTQMRTLTYLRPNDFLEPMRLRGYDFMGGLDIFGSQLSQPSLWLQPPVSSEYIKYLQTWPYRPALMADLVAANIQLPDDTHKPCLAAEDCCPTAPNKGSAGGAQKPYSRVSTALPYSADLPKDHLTLQESGIQTCSNERLPQHNGHGKSEWRGQAHCSSHTTPSVSADPNKLEPGATPTQTKSAPDTLTIPFSTATYGFPPGFLLTHQCVICLDEFAPNTVLCGLPCAHVFHETCIISWLNREKHFCPMCRWPSFKLRPQPLCS
ncbi:E3 ubiquitin-protein ligase RNF103-like [Physella acuta]|uniref:E3 ubiquitin-protein ligase RNF103-like n=1 Tax=Physella acuta TaxID=109671 RepID=UPI0027DE1C92|nr:E3 ubiquitin-protein ligase RNF103-like [Physella acuta]XP_059144751.1 E3 ubiquitin-protein ligase RNF103-like [Physella acuta]XP_059144757.1 E3 ubiquitin-protein ligase RNF103-like [Physella acuta]